MIPARESRFFFLFESELVSGSWTPPKLKKAVWSTAAEMPSSGKWNNLGNIYRIYIPAVVGGAGGLRNIPEPPALPDGRKVKVSILPENFFEKSAYYKNTPEEFR